MKVVERVKIFTGANVSTLEKAYARWYDKKQEEREKVPALKGNPFVIIERSLTIRNYEGDETFALAIFHEDTILEEYEQGKDRGQHLRGGVSMVAGQKPRR